MELRALALHAIAQADPAAKVQAAQAAWSAAEAGVAADPRATLEPPATLPGRPSRPVLVDPARVSRRSAFTPEGRSALLHAVAHIEFNAIDLALDATWRFGGLPQAFYRDWLRVAAEEARHFSLLEAHLATLGHAYGDFPAHDGLWQMAERTGDDVLARMALVPRTLEARGLDASPAVRAKLLAAGDHAAAAIIDVILRDEIGHVATGNRWFHHLCRERALEPVTTYARLTVQYRAPRLHGPFNLAARRAAGFLPEEIVALSAG